MEDRLIKFIEGLEKDIQRLRSRDSFNEIRNLIDESDANLIEDIVESLKIEVLEER